MRLTSFSVRKYRSIIQAHRLPVSSSTVLIGKNNEGKSNILSGLSAAMEVVQQLGRVQMVRGRIRGTTLRRRRYNWTRDFPLQLQQSEPDGESTFRLKFQLDANEREDFKNEVGSALSEELPVEIRMGRGDPFFKVVKQGPGSPKLNRQREKIAEFIGHRIEFSYIPAVRTAQAAIDVVRDMVERALLTLQDDEDYKAAVEQVAVLQEPVLDDLSSRIGDALKEFLPSVESVRVQAAIDDRYRALRRAVDVIVDDGIATSLERKGDGVQSLAAIGLLRGSPGDRQMILALEEPESHLHPSAIHRLRGVLKELADTHQVVLTTHHPVFADRVDIDSNILVESNKAKAATSIVQIREALGVRASDNLRHAEVVLVVEGPTDVKALTAILAAESTSIEAALKNHLLVLDPLGGAGKLTYKLSELRNAIVDYHCFLDNDDAGREVVKKALGEGLLENDGYQVAAPPGGADAELEDLIKVSTYEQVFAQEFGIQLKGKEWKRKGKWSERLKGTATAQGKLWTEASTTRAKQIVAEQVEVNGADALISARRGPVDALTSSLEARLGAQ